MQCNFKKGKKRNSSRCLIANTIYFSLKRTVPFGKAVYACGSIAELGLWDPLRSFRLTWTQDSCWVGTIQLHKLHDQAIEFKFVTSDWQVGEGSLFEWETGQINRKILVNSLRHHAIYNAEWNRQQIVLCLHAPMDSEQFYRYYASGNIEALGSWKANKQLKPIAKDMRETLKMYFKSDSEFACDVNLSTLHTLSFWVSLDAKKINYTYLRKGDGYEREKNVGRSILEGQGSASGRIKEIEWMGSKYIIDEPEFDQLVLEKLTNQLYLTANLKNASHFQKIHEKRITTIFVLNSMEEDSLISNYYLASLCRNKNIQVKFWTVEELTSSKFVNEAREIILNLESMLVNGHRVCLYCSRKFIKSAPIKLLYLTLLDGYPFCEAIEAIRNEVAITETHCKIAEDVLCIVSNKIFRVKTPIKTH